MAKAEADSRLATQQILDILLRVRNIKVDTGKEIDTKTPTPQSSLQQLSHISSLLASAHHAREAETLATVLTLATQTPSFGGLGLREDQTPSADEQAQVLFLVSAWLESLNSEDRAKSPPKPLASRPEGRRGMTLSEKVFAAHDVERRGELKPGDMVRVDVDWIMASELSWGGMKKQYDALGKPGIFRNDRFWLAGDHVVDPRVKDVPLIKQLVADSEAAKTDFMMTEYQGMNYTIMHTEFFRERAQPGMLVIGSDSHTCSSGSLGCLAIGLGVADVTVPLITGETWFKVPESVNIRFVGKPSPGIGGKDTILYILKELKRNTVAAERIVEFTGPGLQYLSCDARFAIANMTAEFGGITGIFTPDQTTHDFITQRKSPRNKKNSKYFRPDADAVYAATHTIDLSAVQSFLARYPSPDDVIPIREHQGMHLDGCFIGACTTAAEDLILAAMVLELAMQKGLRPCAAGKRKVVPGSLPILHRLQELGLDKVYEDAGFEVGVPGCSYCVGMSADKAAEGEVWLSSQNRNFENRMGTGSIGHLASAVSVAASSFTMKTTDPKPLLDDLDLHRLESLLRPAPPPSKHNAAKKHPTYEEPAGSASNPSPSTESKNPPDPQTQESSPTGTPNTNTAATTTPLPGIPSSEPRNPSRIIRGKVQILGDFIDTDALAPSHALLTAHTPHALAPHCLAHTHPTFRALAATGHTIVVAGHAFGCGSSREAAVSALMGTGIQCVIARSFAYIFARNMPNLGLLGVVVREEGFWDVVEEGGEGMVVEVDVEGGRVRVCDGDGDGEAGEVKGEWGFEMSRMERELFGVGGMDRAFGRWGKRLFEVMCAPVALKQTQTQTQKKDDGCASSTGLQW